MQEGTAPGTATGLPDGYDANIGLVAARRAVRVSGDGPRLDAPVHVAAFTPVANVAVGAETPWGVAAELTRLLPGTTGATYGIDSGDPVADALAAAGERRVVAVVRDAHRHPWMAAAVDALLARRPDTVVVEMGLPYSAPRGALYVETHGAARVCGLAAAEALTGA